MRAVFPSSGERIPNFPKSHTLEVLDIDRGELIDSEPQHGKGGPPIVGPAASKVLGSKPGPQRILKGTAVRREADDLPARMAPECSAYIDGDGGFERFGENRGIAQQAIEFQ